MLLLQHKEGRYMKYNENNLPLQCIMTQSTCYKNSGVMSVKGILWHSTGANNPTLRRYVQPDDNAANKTALIQKLGKNNNKKSMATMIAVLFSILYI